MVGTSEIEAHDFVAPDGSSYTLMIPRSDSDYYAHLRQNGGFDEVPRLLWYLLGPRNVLIDVGANLGTISIPLSKKGTRVLAFEILPQNVACMELAKEKNKLNSLQIFHNAVWDERKTVRVGGHEAWGQVSATGNTKVEAIRLDDFVRESGIHPDAVKIDIEGAELAALAGMKQLLSVDGPDIVIEANALTCGARGYSIHDLFYELRKHRYNLFRLAGFSLAPFEVNDFQETICCDYFATRNVKDLLGRIGPWQIGPLAPNSLIALMKAQAACGAEHKRYIADLDLPAEFQANIELMAMREQWRTEFLHEPALRAIKIGTRKVADLNF